MCNDSPCCQKPEELKGKPEECTTEQIAECHPDKEGHPCACKSVPRGTPSSLVQPRGAP